MAHRFLSGIDATTAVIHQPDYNSVAGKAFEVVCGAHLSLPASTEASDIVLGLNRTVQWANGDLTNQRAVVVRAPTYDFFGPGTSSSIDVAATVAIEGPPIEGPNADFLESYSLWIQSGTLALGTSGTNHGSLRVNSSSGYGVTITSGHTTNDYTLTLPIAQGGALTFLQNDGAGNLSWASGGGGSAALLSTRVGFGSVGDVLTGSTKFTWDDTLGSLAITTPALTTTAKALSITSTWNANTSTIVYGIDVNVTQTQEGSYLNKLLRLTVDTVDIFYVTKDGFATITGRNRTDRVLLSSVASTFTVTPGNITLAYNQGEVSDIYFNLGHTLMFNGAATVATQRAVLFTAPTYAGYNSQTTTITTAATVAIAGAPTATTYAPITSSYALWIQTGLLALGTKSSAVGQMLLNNASNANAVTLQSGVTTTSYTLTLPTAQSTASVYKTLVNDGTGTLSWGVLPASSQIGVGNGVGGLVGSNDLTYTSTNGLRIWPGSISSNQRVFEVAMPSVTNSTTLTERNSVLFDFANTRQWANGDFSIQREFWIRKPTYTFVGPATSTIATAATVAIEGTPTAGTNAAITNNYSLWIQAGLLALGTKSSAVGQMCFNNNSNNFAVTIQSGATSASYTLTLPTAQGSASTFLQNDGSGNLSWATAGSSNDTISLQECAEAGSYTIAAGVTLVILEPTATRNQFTLTMPASPADGSSITILGGNFGVDNLTLLPNSGQSFVTGTAIDTMGVGGRAAYEYKSSTARWYRRV